MAEVLVPPPEAAEEAHRFGTMDHISALPALALPPVSMAEVAKVSYVVVLDDEEKKKNRKDSSFRYTRPVLQSTLQLMGCRARHAFKISKRAFELIRNQNSKVSMLPGENDCCYTSVSSSKAKGWNHVDSGEEDRSKSMPFELYKNLTTVTVGRETFLDYVCDALAEYKYVGANQRADLILACRIRERKESITILLCGTSGCGKSTLSSLLGSRLGITTVLSTDSIRHMMRSFVDEEQNPLLWASTYHAGEFLDPVAVAGAKSKRKAKKMDGTSNLHMKDNVPNGRADGKFDAHAAEQGSSSTDLISRKQMAIEGYKAQSEMVIDSLDRLITACEEHKESVIVEGVHLSLNFVMGLMRKHPSIIPFMIHIVNEDKHLERFAVRAKYMTLDPAKNKYVKYIRNIRTIQEYLCKQADKHLVPKINNTNVDKSVAAIHATVFGCLRRRGAGEQLLDLMRNTVTVVDEEYRNQCAANSLSSKGMFQLIQRKGSSRSLMALVNNDGSVARAWPVDLIDRNRKHSDTDVSKCMYGPLQIHKAEPVNLQFGLYGISAWPNDGGTSRAGSVDESRADGTETGSRYFSSCCSSPRMSDAPSKELKEDNSVNGSDEEVDDLPELSSDDDFSDEGDKQILEEVGSVDEESTKSDEEYDDLAMQDLQKDGHWSDADDEYKEQSMFISMDQPTLSQDDSYSHKADFPFCSVSESAEILPAYFWTSGDLQMREGALSSPIFSRASDR